MKPRKDITRLSAHTRVFHQASRSDSGLQQPNTCVQINSPGLTAHKGLAQSSLTPAQKQWAETSGFQPTKLPVTDGEAHGPPFFENEWLTTREAAEYLRIPYGSLKNMTSNGEVPHYKLGRRNRYWLPDLRKLLLSEKRGS